MADEILIFGGSGSPKLTLKICEYLNVQPGAGEVLHFSEGNLFVRVNENVRGRRVYLVQATVFPTNDHVMELLFWGGALKRARAGPSTSPWGCIATHSHNPVRRVTMLVPHGLGQF